MRFPLPLGRIMRPNGAEISGVAGLFEIDFGVDVDPVLHTGVVKLLYEHVKLAKIA